MFCSLGCARGNNQFFTDFVFWSRRQKGQKYLIFSVKGKSTATAKKAMQNNLILSLSDCTYDLLTQKRGINVKLLFNLNKPGFVSTCMFLKSDVAESED